MWQRTMLALALIGCGYETTLLDHDAGPPAPTCDVTPEVVIDVGPEVGCTTMEIQGGGDGDHGCLRAAGGWVDATHLRLERAGNLPVFYLVELIEFDATCEHDMSAGINTCPGAIVPPPGESACECDDAGTAGLSRQPWPYPIPTTLAEDRRMQGRAQDIYFKRAEARYRITVCARDEEPWWECDASTDQNIACDEGVITSSTCLCRQRCATDDDCHVPSTGDSVPECRAAWGCVLPCGETTVCPNGMQCVLADDNERLSALTGERICAEPWSSGD
jgi:hypothetical protein